VSEVIRIRMPGGRGQLVVGTSSDVGCVRTRNEDAQRVHAGESSERGSLLVVADGMGGAAGGEVASRIAVDEVQRVYYAPGTQGTPGQALSSALAAANAAIHAQSEEDASLAGMGTTGTAVAIVENALWWGHVGDSRAYRVHGGRIEQITRDHSLAAELERQGGSGGAPARARNVLTRCLGVREDVRIDVGGPLPLGIGDTIVLCSDGLSNQVEPAEMLEAVTSLPPDAACKSLVRLARARGGPDNITVVVGALVPA
jgi:protein phosphatase